MLFRWVQQLLAERFPGRALERLERRRFEGSTSYPCYLLRAHAGDGEPLCLFMKDFSTSALPKDAPDERQAREVTVYREVLAGRDLGTPHCYGTLWRPEERRCWLFLEWVDAPTLRSFGFDAWAAAARWLGRMQGHVARRPLPGRPAAALVRHDAEFFATTARRALAEVSRVSPRLAARLARAVRDAEPFAARALAPPPTLVHGSYRRDNILIAGRRVCPIDWELSALGSPLYDFAFLADGYSGERLRALWRAYCRGLREFDLPSPDWAEAWPAVRFLQLHKRLKSLCGCVERGFPLQTVEKIVAMAESPPAGIGVRASHGRRT
jgi:hypothetical protein